MMRLAFVFIISICFAKDIFSQAVHENARLDVVSYNATLEPDLKTKSIAGNVTIVFLYASSDVTFNSGGLRVSNVVGENVKAYQQRDKKLIISLKEPSTEEIQVQVFFSGNPTSGLVFPEEGQGYTFFFTSDWLVCNDAPSDKATCTLELLIPEDKACVASGVLTKKEKKGEKLSYQWNLDFAAPTYTYGFAIGIFNSYKFRFRGIELNHYSKDYSTEKLQKIFNNTGDMIDYFEKRSGLPYPSMAYSQILIGDHYQEMSGFSLLKKSYGDLVLKDTTETNLISHELAHQWWGNQITCESWNHIWLNEGLTTFMSAAYNEHRFGPEKYKADIEAYQNVYLDLVRRGKDKSLVFGSWKNATSDDRNLVYFKGAYVLDLLRVELGDEVFWNGIKEYSQQYFGKTVNTFQFQKTMEGVAGRELHTFFDKWVNKKV